MNFYFFIEAQDPFHPDANLDTDPGHTAQNIVLPSPSPDLHQLIRIPTQAVLYQGPRDQGLTLLQLHQHKSSPSERQSKRAKRDQTRLPWLSLKWKEKPHRYTDLVLYLGPVHTIRQLKKYPGLSSASTHTAFSQCSDFFKKIFE